MKLKRAINSVSDFAEYVNENVKTKARIPKTYGKYVVNYVSAFSTVMKTSRGRDKICSVFQYAAELYYACNKYSEIEEVRQRVLEGLSVSADIAYKTRASMKSARKVFKFLKFMDELVSIYKLFQKKKYPGYIIFLKFISHLFGFFHNIMDNLLWGINIGVLSSVYDQKTYKHWKAGKHSISLAKIIVKLMTYNFAFQIRNREIRKILTELKPLKEAPITEDSPAHDLCLRYLKQRSEFRFELLDSFLMALRVIMLVRKLKLPGHQFVTSILQAACGLMSTILSTIKMLIEQPILIEIHKEEDAKAENQSNASTAGSFEPAKRVKVGNLLKVQSSMKIRESNQGNIPFENYQNNISYISVEWESQPQKSDKKYKQ